MHGSGLIGQYIRFNERFAARSGQPAKYYRVVRKEVKLRQTKVLVEMLVVNLPDAMFREKYLALREFIRGGKS